MNELPVKGRNETQWFPLGPGFWNVNAGLGEEPRSFWHVWQVRRCEQGGFELEEQVVAGRKSGAVQFPESSIQRPAVLIDKRVVGIVALQSGAHLGTATVAQTGNLLCRGFAIRPPAEYHSAKPRFGIGTSLRYKPASIRIGGSAKMRLAEC